MIYGWLVDDKWVNEKSFVFWSAHTNVIVIRIRYLCFDVFLFFLVPIRTVYTTTAIWWIIVRRSNPYGANRKSRTRTTVAHAVRRRRDDFRRCRFVAWRPIICLYNVHGRSRLTAAVVVGLFDFDGKTIAGSSDSSSPHHPIVFLLRASHRIRVPSFFYCCAARNSTLYFTVLLVAPPCPSSFVVVVFDKYKKEKDSPTVFFLCSRSRFITLLHVSSTSQSGPCRAKFHKRPSRYHSRYEHTHVNPEPQRIRWVALVDRRGAYRGQGSRSYVQTTLCESATFFDNEKRDARSLSRRARASSVRLARFRLVLFAASNVFTSFAAPQTTN